MNPSDTPRADALMFHVVRYAEAVAEIGGLEEACAPSPAATIYDRIRSEAGELERELSQAKAELEAANHRTHAAELLTLAAEHELAETRRLAEGLAEAIPWLLDYSDVARRHSDRAMQLEMDGELSLARQALAAWEAQPSLFDGAGDSTNDPTHARPEPR